MRINNKRIGIYIETLYKFLFLGVLFSILLILIPIPKIVNFVSPWYLLIFFVGLIILLPKFGHQIFIYNSDGEVLNIKTEDAFWAKYRSEEHTSELQSRGHLVCRLLLEKKNKSNKQMR